MKNCLLNERARILCQVYSKDKISTLRQSCPSVINKRIPTKKNNEFYLQ